MQRRKISRTNKHFLTWIESPSGVSRCRVQIIIHECYAVAAVVTTAVVAVSVVAASVVAAAVVAAAVVTAAVVKAGSGGFVSCDC